MEAVNVTSGYGAAWDIGQLRYTYQLAANQSDNATCNAEAPVKGDRPGGDLATFVLPSLNASLCASYCCSTPSCVGYVMDVSPGPFMTCKAGDPCCFLKAQLTDIQPGDAVVNAAVTQPQVNTEHPPVGIRSAVPLGGVSCGSVELRGDGRFYEWTIVNQSPGGSPKFGVVDQAVMAVRTVGHTNKTVRAATIRTRPVLNLPTVAALRYQGSYPVSRLDVLDPSFPVELSIFGFSTFAPGDLNRSVTPAIVLSLNAYNPSLTEAQDVSFMLSLPFSVESDTVRVDASSVDSILASRSAATAVDCLHLCDAAPDCASWTWQENNCTTMRDVPPNNYESDTVSGVAGNWTVPSTAQRWHGTGVRAASPSPITLSRVGFGPTAGNVSLWPLAYSGDQQPITVSTSLGAGDDLAALFAQFAANGEFDPPSSPSLAAAHGAAAVTTSLAPGQRVTLSIVFSWYFPYRDHVGSDRTPKTAITIGNWYQNLFDDSEQVTESIADSLTDVVDTIAALHSVYLQTSMPEPLIDNLINSVSHIRSAIYSASGVWRQWEAYDCADIDSVHNDYQRHMPYILYFPETEKQKIRAHAVTQQGDGMIQEELSGGCTGPIPPWESASTRPMGDVSSLFILEIWQLYAWSNDLAFVRELWTNISAAARWQISVSPTGLPEHLVNTYDLLGLSQYQLCTFNAVLHLAAMRATMELGAAVGDAEMVRLANTSFMNGSSTIESVMWVMQNGTGYYQSYNGQPEHAVMADSLYGQVVAYTLGIGRLLPIEKIRSHLLSEVIYNDSPYGLVVETGRLPLTDKTDNAIWTGGSQDWSALALRVFADLTIDEAMAQSNKGLELWRSVLNDQWNTHGLASADGYTDTPGGLPINTAHYGFHMVLWHIPFSLSGQTAYMFNSTLTFDPVTPVPFTLPLLLPTVLGLISARYSRPGRTHFTLSLLFGSLNVKTLRIGAALYPHSVSLQAGEQIEWELEETKENNAQIHSAIETQWE